MLSNKGLFGISHDARRGQQSTAHLRGLLSPLSEKTMRNARDPNKENTSPDDDALSIPRKRSEDNLWSIPSRPRRRPRSYRGVRVMQKAVANPHPSIRAQRCFALLGMLVVTPLDTYDSSIGIRRYCGLDLIIPTPHPIFQFPARNSPQHSITPCFIRQIPLVSSGASNGGGVCRRTQACPSRPAPFHSSTVLTLAGHLHDTHLHQTTKNSRRPPD